MLDRLVCFFISWEFAEQYNINVIAANLKGSGYTVEEQVSGIFCRAGRQLDSISSPQEFGIVVDQLVLEQ